jgi:hypothetical protein
VLVIREDQMRMLDAAQVERFADDLVAHIEGFAPTQFASLGKMGIRNTISIGLRNARSHGFTLRGPARLYVEAMFMLGSFFDTDPQYRGIDEGRPSHRDAQIRRTLFLYYQPD